MSPTRPKVRPSWSQYFIDMAAMASTRATCNRAQVGVVMVKNGMIVSTGYNGSMKGDDHCDDVGHLMEDSHCVRTVHAEANAVAQAACAGASLDGATAFITTFPCWPCFKLMVNAGVDAIVYRDDYRVDDKVTETADRLRIDLVKHDAPNEGTHST